MKHLSDLLIKEKYKKTKFKFTKTKHLFIKASVNGIKGNFILDTGASNSCVGFESIELFNLTTSHSTTKAAGAGAIGMFTQLAKSNNLQIGRWKDNDFHLVVFDLSHVNAALQEYKAKQVHGIIGADVLISGNAIIDYENKVLYLK